MRELTLRLSKVYTPDKAGLTTPLLFTNTPLALAHNGLVLPLRKVRAEQVVGEVKQQVSLTKFDRIIYPVWMVSGELAGGFFKGALRPYWQIPEEEMRSSSAHRLLEFHFYLEWQGSPKLGKALEAEPGQFADMVRGYVSDAETRLIKDAVGPEFKVQLPSPHFLATFGRLED